MSRFARNTAFSSLAGLCTALGSMISAILVARLLGPSGSGVVIFGLWIVATTAALADGGLSAALARFIPELTGQGQDGRVPGLIRHLARPAILLALGVPLAMAAIAFGPERLAPWADLNATFTPGGTVILLLLCAAQTLSNLYLFTLRGLQRFDDVARLVSISMVAQLVLVVAGALIAGASGAFCGYLAGLVGPAMLSFRLLRRADGAPGDLRRRVRRYALFTWAANITSLLVWSRLEIVFLKHSFGDEMVGMYSVGLTLASLAVQGPLLFTGGLLAYFSERSGSSDHDAVEAALGMAMRLMAAFILPLSFGLCALAPRLIPILYGPSFAPAAPAAMILIAATAFGAIGVVGSNLTQARERSDFMFYLNVGGGVLAVVGGFLVIPTGGLVGAALLRAAIQILMLVCGWSFIMVTLKFRVPLRQIALLVGASIVCALAAHACLQVVPGLPGLPLAILSGGVAYLLALRLLRALPGEDLRTMQGALANAPRPVRALVALGARLLGGDGSAAPLAASRSTTP